MILIFLYGLVILWGVIIPIIVLLYAFFQIIAEFKGAPYVPTSDKILREILESANLKKGQKFIELGSGDGRVTRLAVKFYHVEGLGIDINPMLVLYSQFLAKREGLKDIEFKKGDLFKQDLSSFDVLFLFLLPETLRKLKDKILKDCKKDTLIISHGFVIKDLDEYLIKKVNRPLFPTYYYLLK